MSCDILLCVDSWTRFALQVHSDARKHLTMLSVPLTTLSPKIPSDFADAEEHVSSSEEQPVNDGSEYRVVYGLPNPKEFCRNQHYRVPSQST